MISRKPAIKPYILFFPAAQAFACAAPPHRFGFFGLPFSGEMPPYGWTLSREGEPDHTEAITAIKVCRKTVATLKARQRRNREAQSDKLPNRYLTTRKIRSASRKLEALNDVEARLLMQCKIQSGEITLDDFRALKAAMLPDDHYSRRAKQKTHSQSEKQKQNGPGERRPKSSPPAAEPATTD